ncbi:MAG TPA: L-histidine N(alpha)-methyltransferase [Thermoanaerobaculia bacterium]|nr:L-histidine N(alpha)-methyltransferase [Thermoanaerobaculia bacterium]
MPLVEIEDRTQVDHPLETADRDAVLAELREGLTATPRRLPSKYFYDDRGSELFERITEQPEYYPTRTEAALLADVADEVVRLSGARELVEIGSGAATKTRLLLDAMERAGQLHLYVPMDVSEGTVRRVARELAGIYPRLNVHGVVGDFMNHLGHIPDSDERLVIFLGGTIGNLSPEVARRFLSDLGDQMRRGEHLLLGVDRIKDRATLEAAYDDDAGVTAAFNLNILPVVNGVAGGDFDPARFRHVSRWNEADHRIEMWLAATEAHRVHLADLGLTLDLEAGEEILTEISTKYDRALAAELLADSGFALERWYTDAKERFALCLAAKV